MDTHILVTTDVTDIGHAAVRHAAELTRALRASLTLLHIVPDTHVELSSGNDLSVSAATIEQEWETDGQRALQEGGTDPDCRTIRDAPSASVPSRLSVTVVPPLSGRSISYQITD